MPGAPSPQGVCRTGLLVGALAVLTGDLHVATLWRLAEVSLLTRRPLLPPSRVRVKLETGASGTVSKLVRMPCVDGVDLAVEVDVDLAV